jgi:hypothetical protein
MTFAHLGIGKHSPYLHHIPLDGRKASSSALDDPVPQVLS